MKINQKSLYVGGDVLSTLRRCRGYYKRPIGGPLVGYAGTYEPNLPGEPAKKHYVGFEYINCAKAEQYPLVRMHWAKELSKQWGGQFPEVVLGAPMGGILFADSLAAEFGCKVVFAEKKIKSASETSTGRDETELVLDRHEIEPGDTVLIAEDVCNSFSTTAELVKLILSYNAVSFGIGCIVNRSESQVYLASGLPVLPVHSLLWQPTKKFRQDDPLVAEDIEKGNVVWKPKSRENWAKLMQCMKAAEADFFG